MKTIALTSFVSMFTLAAALTLTPFAVQSGAAQSGGARDHEKATARMIAALDIHEGSIVAEMGAGSGGRTIDIAKHVGASGRVYSTELGEDRLRNLRNAIEKSGAKNVTVLAAHATQTNLEEGCCDALFMEHVYHHFEDPAAINASIFRTVKPGGRVAVVDFAPRGGNESKDPKDRDEDGHHGVKASTVQAELERAGFELVKVDKVNDEGFLVVMRKPSTSSAPGSDEATAPSR
jgi:ubiquinone/menaquinone biosynthesis C-methylase UbiE